MGLLRAQTGQGLGKAHPLHLSAVGSTLGHTKVHLRTFWGHTEEMKFGKLEDVTGTRGKQGREDKVCKRLSKHLYLWVHLNQTALKFFLMNYLGKVEYEKLDLGLYAGDVSRHSKSPFSRSAPVYHRKSEILWIILQRKPKWGVTSQLKITKQCDFGHEKQDRRQQNRAGCGTRVRQNRVSLVGWGGNNAAKASGATLRYSHSDPPLPGEDDKTSLLAYTGCEAPVLLGMHPLSAQGGTPAPPCNQPPTSWSASGWTRTEEVAIMP